MGITRWHFFTGAGSRSQMLPRAHLSMPSPSQAASVIHLPGVISISVGVGVTSISISVGVGVAGKSQSIQRSDHHDNLL